MEKIILYLNPFLISFCLSIVFVSLINILSEKFIPFLGSNIRLGKRHIHQKNISRFGGLAIFCSFFLTIFINENLVITRDIVGIFAGGVVIFILGFCDDLWEIDWKKQIFFQILAISLIFAGGVKINYSSLLGNDFLSTSGFWGLVLGFLIGLIWSLILINAMNWLDGMDGLSGGVYLIVLLAVFLLSLKPEVNQPPVGILSLSLAGGVLGFLIFNFPPAKIMIGSNGVFFVGFILAGMSIFAGMKIATTLMILFIPMADFFWVIGKRILLGKSIFSPDKEHLHHKLLNIGWSQRMIIVFFYLVTLVVTVVALNVRGFQKILMILFLFFAMWVFYVYINKREDFVSGGIKKRFKV